MSKIVKIDDFLIRKSEKGSKNLKRKPRKRAEKCKIKSEFIKAVALLDRNGISSDIPMEKVKGLEFSNDFFIVFYLMQYCVRMGLKPTNKLPKNLGQRIRFNP